MDTGAIERLAERIERSRAQEATITKETVAERDDSLQPERDSQQLRPPRRRAGNRVADEDGIVRDPRDLNNEHREDKSSTVPQTERGREAGPIDIRDAEPGDVRVNVMDLGETQLAYSQNVYDLQSHTGEPTHTLFGGWQTDKQLGFIAVTQTDKQTNVHIATEDRGDREIAPELVDRIGQIIEHSRAQQATPADRANTPEPDREREYRPVQPAEIQSGQPAELQPAETAIEPEIQQIIQEQQDRQQDWEHGISPDQENDRDNDLGYGIE